MTTALIDADILAYQAAITSEFPAEWGDGLWTLHAFEEDGQRSFETILNGIMDATKADDCVLAFSDSANWRKEILPTYKSNRAGVRKPMLLKALREYAQENYACFIRPTLEGDDVLGILATSPKLIKGDKIVCSIDKDFRTIPGKHYNFKSATFFEITSQEADKWHMMQTLTGDSTDGYAGCPGCGKVTADKILTSLDPKDYWTAVKKAYQAAGLGEEEALVQARVARICRNEDYDFKKKRVKLWNPPVTTK
jgi:DNA polymerase-1